MPFSTYSELQEAIAGWLARDDLTDRIPDFIALVEARLSRELRSREMVTDEIGTMGDQVVAIPTDFIEVYRFVIDTTEDQILEYRPYEDAHLRVGNATRGEPRYYTILGETFIIYPSPDADYTYALAYYARIPALTDVDTTNWLLEKAPDAYLFGALMEAAPYLMDDARIGYWDQRFQAAVASLHAVESRSKRTGGPKRPRILT